MQNHILKYGNKKLELEIPGASSFLEVNEPIFQVEKSSFLSSLNKLLSLNKGDSIGIIVSDKTRLCGYEIYLPWLTENLESRGINPGDITFYIAYGTHPRQSDEESLNAYGETFERYKFIHHNCDDLSELTKLGTTSSGTDVEVRRDIFAHNSLILFGAVSHHYFAGYGGGRKLIFPGLASRKSIYHNHKLFIDFEGKRLDPGCQSGELDGNPVAEDLREVDMMLPDKLIISGVLDTKGRVAVLKFNKSYSEFRDTCSIYDSSYRSPVKKKFDMVIASAGGYPKDINFIQTHKSMHNAASFVKDNGTLILLGECRDGIGNNTFIDIFSGSSEEIIDDLRTNYSGNGGTALSTLSKTSRIKVLMHTELPESHCLKMGITKVDLDRIGKEIAEQTGTVAIIDNASIIF